MPERTDISFVLVLLGLSASFSLTACGDQSDADEVSTTSAHGWTSSVDNDTFRMERRLEQLSVSFELDPGRTSAANDRVTASPCLNGRGEEFAQANFAPNGDDDVSRLASIRGRLDEVIGTVSDKCDFPEDLSQRIMAGFDGMYFRTSGDRAKLKSS